MVKKRDLSDFECGMVVGARRADLSISKIYWNFHAQPSLGRRIFRGEWADWLEMIERQQ